MRTFLVISTLVVMVLGLFLPPAPLAAASGSDSILLILTIPQGQGAVPPEMRLAPILNSLQAHQKIKQFEWLADANAFRVQGLDTSLTPMLNTLPGVSRITPANASNLQDARQAQRVQTIRTQRARTLNTAHPSSPTNTPYFEVQETWDVFQAKNLAQGQAVTVVLKDSGASVKDTLNVNADIGGYINKPFNADVVQGDYVEITYNSTTVTIHSDAITIDFDFANNHIMGTAAANRNLYVGMRDEGIGWCEHHEFFASTSTNSAGGYDFALTGNYDVIRRTQADVTSVDAEGNGWTVSRHAPWLIVSTQLNNTNGKGNGLAPNEDVSIDLKTGPTLKANSTSHTNSPDASFGFGFGQADMLPGDTLYATENSNNWAAINIVTLSVLLNPANGKVTGRAPANQQVVLQSSHYNRSTGNWEGSCKTTTANASGKYGATFAVPFIGGDSVTAYYVDSEGFEQQVWDSVPYLQLYPNTNLLQGLFHANFDGQVDITVANKDGAIKYQGTGYAFGGWWSQILAQNGASVTLAPNDKVTVKSSPGTLAAEADIMLTATVAKINATLDLDQNKVSGTAPKNAHLGFYAQIWSGNNFNCRDECNQPAQADANGAFGYTFHNDLVTGDYAEVVLIDAHGHQTIKRAFSTTPTLTLDSAPATFRRGRQNAVKYTIANGQHVTDTGVLSDSASRPDWHYTLQNGPDGNWWPGGPGQYTVNVGIPFQGKIYFRAFAWVDGRYIVTTPEQVAKAR